MSEPLILTRPQQAVVQKVASHFKVSQKIARAGLDRRQLDESGILYFRTLDESDACFQSTFSAVQGAFNLGQVLDPKKFQKTFLYEAWTQFQATYNKDFEDVVMAYMAGGGLWAIENHRYTTCTVGRGDGAIILGYEYLEGHCMRLLPMVRFLAENYPLPQE
jgi:hypothetical protein